MGAVKGHYPNNPDAAFFAEAPGKDEVYHNQPLTPSGDSGRIFARLLNITGLSRRRVVIDNFIQTKLPGNDTSSLYKITSTGKIKLCSNWDDLVDDYKERVLNCGADLIYLIGATAVIPLFGFKFSKISEYRGYPIYWENKLVIPTYHPASVIIGRQPQHFYTIYADILKGLRIRKQGRKVARIVGYLPGKDWEVIDL